MWLWSRGKPSPLAAKVCDPDLSDMAPPGPQQARKPVSNGDMSQSSPNAKALPNSVPAAQAPATQAPATISDDIAFTGASGEAASNDRSDSEDFQGMGSLIERQYNLSNREAPPGKKRKVQAAADGEEEDAGKAKSKFSGGSSNGVLGQHIREEREKAAKESGPTSEPIDLTNDDDEVQILGSRVSSEDSRIVCLGMVRSQANVHHIPRCPRNQQNVLGRGMYPQMRVNYKRVANSTMVIDLFDRSPNGDKMGNKFGKLDVKTAAALSPLLDGEEINGMSLHVYLQQAEKRVGEFEGARVSRAMATHILVFAPKMKAIGIGKILSQKGIFLDNPDGVPMRRDVDVMNPHVPISFGPKPQKRGNAQPAYGVARSQEEMVRETNSMFDNLVKVSEIPEMEPEKAAIKTEMKGLQKQALHFLVQHERADVADDSPQMALWKQRETPKGRVWYNVISNHEISQRPDPVRGGILADEMGLGKTLNVLALHASTRHDANSFGEEEAPIEMESITRNVKATLIICPKSVMSNWVQQIKEHTTGSFFKTYQYHGANREQDADKLAEFDIVLAPYGTVAAEFAYKNGTRTALASLNWFRIVLDEAHSIRTPSTQVSRACCALTAQRRWAVTGTPVQNRLDDLGTLIKFLRIKPFDDDKSWALHIMAPFKSANEHVLGHLQLLVASVTLRRTKEKVGLPKRTELQIKLQFDAEERAMYAQFSGQANLQVRAMTRDKGRIQGKGYAFMLRSIHRLRAICAHGREMLSEDDMKELEGLTAQTAIDLGDEPEDGEPDSSFITEGQAYDFLHMMVESESDLCEKCGNKIVKKEEEGEQTDTDDSGREDSDSESSDDEDPEEAAKKDVLGYINPCYDHLICPKCKPEYVTHAEENMRADSYHKCMFCDGYIRFGLYELKFSSLRAFIDSKSAKTKKQRTKWDESTYSGPHTKVKALIDDLKQSAKDSEGLPRGEPPLKSVIFSGWTTYLDLIEYALDENAIKYTRLDGTMSIKQRTAVLDKFRMDPDITVILVSIKAGGQGLNLTSASRVYMMEPQFNPGVEQQAVDRVHRLGQEREVVVTHFVMEESIEEKIQVMQQKKQQLARLAMDKKLTRGEAAKQRAEELRKLF